MATKARCFLTKSAVKTERQGGAIAVSGDMNTMNLASYKLRKYFILSYTPNLYIPAATSEKQDDGPIHTAVTPASHSWLTYGTSANNENVVAIKGGFDK